jgi:hypothetical protein
LGRWGKMRRKPGTDTKFPAQFAGNWLSVPGFAPGICCPSAVPPKRLSTFPERHPPATVEFIIIMRNPVPTATSLTWKVARHLICAAIVPVVTFENRISGLCLSPVTNRG